MLSACLYRWQVKPDKVIKQLEQDTCRMPLANWLLLEKRFRKDGGNPNVREGLVSVLGLGAEWR